MRTATVTVAGLLALAGCATAAPAPTTPPVSFGVPTATPSPAPVTLTPEQEALFGPRVELPGGLLLKQIGKVAQYGGPDDEDPNTFGVRLILDKIAVDPKCGPYVSKPERGHRLVLSMRVETSSDFDPGRDGPPQFYKWSTVSSDGVTEGPPSSALDCREATALPQELRRAAKYRGDVTVESSNTAGQLVFGDFAVWNYPQ